MSAILAIDQGTTGVTALVVDADGRLLGRGYRELTSYFPNPGEVEQDPDEIRRVALSAAREAMRQAQVVPTGLGITNQRETVCVWERDSGAAANDFLMQLQAVPVARPDVIETTALGAAALAGLALGVWANPADFLAGRSFTRFVPGPHASAVRAHQAEWRRAIDTALAWAAGSELDRSHRPARRRPPRPGRRGRRRP